MKRTGSGPVAIAGLTVLMLLVAVSAWAAGGTLYVQSARASLQDNPRLGAVRVAELKRGDALTELESAAGWYKVRFGNKTGWVSRLVVSPKAPMGTVSVLGGKSDNEIEGGARRRASSFTTAAAARGLAEDRARLSQKFRVDYEGVTEMEELAIPSDEAVAFVQDKEAGR